MKNVYYLYLYPLFLYSKNNYAYLILQPSKSKALRYALVGTGILRL